MVDEDMTNQDARSRIIDGPLRLWHWAFGGCVAFSLYTGLDGDIGLLEWHVYSGMTIVGLVVFRIGWALWGGRYARLPHYRTTPRRFLDHFRGRALPSKEPSEEPSVHTAPGAALALLLFAAVAVQATTGLFATDDIFTEGPLARKVGDDIAYTATYIHNRLYWLIIAGIGVHLSAHVVYGLILRDPTPLAMFTGSKRIDVEDTPHYWPRALATAALAAAVVWLIDYSSR